MMDNTFYDPVILHLPKLLNEHFLRDSRYRALEIREAQNIPAKKVKQDHQLPAPFEKLQRILDAFGRSLSRILM